MGFNTVYRFLGEMFPQVDARLLKAVAIEHSKDADVAANIVLTEILPYWTKRSMMTSPLPVDNGASSSSSKDQSLRDLSDVDGAEQEGQSTLFRRKRIIVRRRIRNASSCLEPGANATGCATNCNSAVVHSPDSAGLSKGLNASKVPEFYDVHDGNNQLLENNENEEVILLGKTEEKSSDVGSNKVSNIMPNTTTNDGDGNTNMSEDTCAYTESDESVSSDKGQDINIMVEPEQNTFVMSTPSIHENGVANNGPLATDTDSQLVPSSVGKEHARQLGIHSRSVTGDCKEPDVCGSSDLKSQQVNFISENDAVEDDSMINTVVTRSGQICRIDLLEEIIQDAKKNKKTLFTAMESVMNMIREVELKEKAAEEAKAEAARGGLDILMKVEELKQMLSHAKNANDMHAGEVYGEKAILATEARELQNRLLSLSEERDNSLAILDEMRETLEGRLAAAEEMRKAAVEEKLEKEESARKSLAEIEAIMEKVVQESKILQQEAEENSKLREFLMDRGHVVDSLQGEISVICQDVRFLKEKFDERVPLSKSVSSSQTTCILASSGSSIRSTSTASLVAEHSLISETPEETSSTLLIDNNQFRKGGLKDERTGADCKELLEDGWDFFENDTEICGRAL